MSEMRKWISLVEDNDGGDCYQAAWRKITSIDFEEAKSWRLVHAEVVGRGGIKGKHFGHAWLEKTTDIHGHKIVMVLDCANNRNVELPKDFYYDMGGVVDEPGKLFRYTADEARRFGVRSGNYGSWELDIEKEGVNEEFLDAFRTPGDHVIELFKNPTKKELNEINIEEGFIRGFLTKDSLIVWNAYDSTHFKVSQYLDLNPDNTVGIYLYYSPHESNIGVQVTDYNRKGKWHHNPTLKDWILNHPAWWVDTNYIDVSYYDEAEVGKWEDLVND